MRFLLSPFVILATLLSLWLPGNALAQPTHRSVVTLRYDMWSQSQVPLFQEMIAKFRQTHSNIDVKIEIVPFTDYATKLAAEAQANDMPDVFSGHASFIIEFMQHGLLMPLNTMISQDHVNLKNYPKLLVDLYSFKGKHYGIPRNYDLIGLYYNKQLFRQAHAAFPSSKWTWNTFLKAAQKLTNPQKGVWGFAAPGSDQTGYWNLIYQNGGNVISRNMKQSGFSNPKTVQALQFWSDLINKYHVSPTYQQMTETSPTSLFESGKVAMVFDGDWMASEYSTNDYTRGKVNVAPLPHGKKHAVILHGSANVISAQTKHPKEAWEFVKFLGSKPAQEIQALGAASGPPAMRSIDPLWIKSTPGMDLKVFVSQIRYSVLYPHSANTPAWLALQNKYIPQALAGNLSMNDATRTLAQQMNQVLQQGG